MLRQTMVSHDTDTTDGLPPLHGEVMSDNIHGDEHATGDEKRGDLHEACVRLALLGPALLLAKLLPTRQMPDENPGIRQGNARKRFLLGILTELQKAGLMLRHVKDSRDSITFPPSAGECPSSTLMLEFLSEEQIQQVARLQSMLVLLANFSTTNEPVYFHHFLLLEERERCVAALAGQEAVSRAERIPMETAILRLDINIAEVERKIHRIATCHYLDLARDLPPAHAPRLAGYGTQRARAVSRLSDVETEITARDEWSDAVIYPTGVRFSDHGLTDEDRCALLDRGEVQCAYLIRAILGRVCSLSGLDARELRDLTLTFDEAMERARTRNPDQIGLGDVVLVGGPYLAEVREVMVGISRPGRYRVRYLIDRPISEVEDAWVSRGAITVFARCADFTADMLSLLRSQLPDEDLREFEVQDGFLNDFARKGIIQAWESGFRDYVRRARRAWRIGDGGIPSGI